MFFSFIKDFILLFLLVYALITLAEQLCRMFERLCRQPSVITRKFYVIDISEIDCTALECFLRKELSNCRCKVLLTAKKQNSESNFIISRLRRQYPETYFVTKKELKKMLNCQAKTDVFSKVAQEADPGQDK